ncbi:putative zinc finger protein [Schistosoma mansoni]|uniref:putative zinc finger protein n=1 Tax=Schistosoma mansoni TaxID=6183 RepID=UPI00022DC9E0|nr:putative zinc finger protein [Schistosoma mansoni]|eukprot:XP_018654439.1 putative zinc finger protein [Schistosoma mansoni]
MYLVEVDALVRMNRSQLQKFAQYLIASHPNKILPSAQQLADQLLQPESNINKTSGAPDPTAGGSLQDVAAWYLDEAGVREQLRVELTNLASNGLYGTNHNVNNLRLSSGGRCNSPNGVSNFNSAGQQQQSNTTNRSSTSSSFMQRSNNSHRSYPNSSTSLGIDSGMGSQNDIDYNDSTEVGLDWLLRYRRLTLNQNLLIGGGIHSSIGGNNNTCTNSYTLHGLDLAYNNYIPLSIDHSQSSSTASNNTTTNLNTNNNHNNNNDHNNNHTNNNRLYYSSTSPFHYYYYYWPNSIDTQFDSNLHNCDNQLNHNGNNGNGTQIPAMFAKVRELLAKRDSNGPRLLSLITEELLNCSKLPVIKSRRNQRNATIDVPNRLQTIATPRISHGQQSLNDRQYSSETLSANSVNNGYNNSSSSLNQSPPWTVRLWEEVCLLWTCVVLSPDCSVEAKRQWRYRFLTWARANRCPRDESYSIPSHFLTSIHELNDVDDDVPGQNQQTQQHQPSCQQSTRPCRRASVFRLPIEASYMSWDDVWWNHLSIHDMKLNKHEHEHREDANGGRQNHSTNISIDESSSDCGRIFRRPSSITPRRSIGFNNRSFQPNSSPRECQCPYCDHSGPLNEPFPLLCLRVAALRSNGYLSQALQLAVFISQRLLRSVKMKTSLAATSIINNVQRSPPQTFSSHTSWNNNCHPNDIVARRMLFNTPPNGQTLRVNGMSSHNVMHNSGSRYLSSPNMPPSPSMIPNHGKFSPSNRLTSPRPASLSPPVNVTHHSRPVSVRRHGLSPNSNPSPVSFHNPYQPTTTNHHNYHKHIPHTNSPYSCPPPPHGIGSSVGCANGSSNNNIMMMMHPSHHNRSINSPTPINRHVISRPFPSSYPTNPNVFGGEFFPITEIDINCGLISTNCPSHTDVGWIGLPGRPILCLVECLLDAAAIVVEAANHQTPPIALPSWGHMEKASFYLCLAVKISLLSLFQQRRLVGSISRLLACQHQETRLLTLLNTIPKDVTTALTISRWFSSPLSSVTTTSPPTVGVPTSITTSNNPIHSTLNNSNNRFATIDNNQLIVGNNMNNNNLSLNQNPQYRRCLETLKLRQTRLAVALIRVSKSHIHRLDQIVQICNQNIHSAVSLLAISQQVFAEAVGWKLRSPVNRKPNNTNLLESAYSECGCLLNSNPPPGLILPTATNPTIESFYTRDRIFLISTAFHLALIVVLRTLSRSVHWRRREMLAWAVTTALHVGPPACLYLIYHWSSYVNPREAVSWLAPALLTAVGTLDVNTPTNVTSRMSKSLSTNKLSKDPINCSLPALNLSVKDPIAFDAIYRLVLNSAETGGLGPIQLFSLARYMDNCGWTWRAFPFALHATRLFVLSTTQESHPVGNDVLWACLLGHRLGPGALQEILNHVIRNIHCPTLLTDILHRCRSIPCGVHINSTNCNINMNNNNINGIDSSSSSSSMMMMNNNMTNSIPSVGRGNSCATHFCNPTPHYVNNNNNGTGVSGCTGKMLSLDRPPLKGLLDAAINGFVMATHMRLANISPRQYAEFVDFLTRARDTFHLLRPDGPLQFRSLVECLRQTYRGKRKLVSLLSERFG